MVGCLSTREPISALNESPSEKEGKCNPWTPTQRKIHPLNESPSEKEGKLNHYGK